MPEGSKQIYSDEGDRTEAEERLLATVLSITNCDIPLVIPPHDRSEGKLRWKRPIKKLFGWIGG